MKSLNYVEVFSLEVFQNIVWHLVILGMKQNVELQI